MREWSLARVVWVADRGFTSAENRRYLRRAGGHYILGEKLRSGSAEATAVLARQGRYATVANNLQVKEVKIGDLADDRFIICYNPGSRRARPQRPCTRGRPADRATTPRPSNAACCAARSCLSVEQRAVTFRA
jgi:hypothetical protein